MNDREFINAVSEDAGTIEGVLANETDVLDLTSSLLQLRVISREMGVQQAATIVAQHITQS